MAPPAGVKQYTLHCFQDGAACSTSVRSGMSHADLMSLGGIKSTDTLIALPGRGPPRVQGMRHHPRSL